MNIGWNYRREHLRAQQRSHYVITNGGDQPNVVPPIASVWYYFRETTIRQGALGDRRQDRGGRGADDRHEARADEVLGSAWPQHFNKIVAETMNANIKRSACRSGATPTRRSPRRCSRSSVPRGGGLDREARDQPAEAEEREPRRRVRRHRRRVVERADDHAALPSNIPGLPGHNWANAIAMATPIAHKGATAGAKAQAMTMIDLLLRRSSSQAAWDYFRNVQTKDTKYQPLIRPEDKPAIGLNKETMDEYRPEMRSTTTIRRSTRPIWSSSASSIRR